MKFLCDNCKAKYQIGDDKVAGKTVRMKCRRCGHMIQVNANVTEGSVSRRLSPAPFAAPEPPASEPAAVTGAGHHAPSVPFNLGARGVPARALEPEPEPHTAPISSPRPVAPAAPAPRPAVAGVPRRATPAPQSSAGRPGAVPARPSSISTSALAAAHTAHPKPVQALTGAFARSVSEQAPPSAHVTPSDDWYVGVAGVPVGPIRLAAIREKASVGQVDGDSLVWREGFDEWQPLRNFPELLELVEEGRHSIPARRPSGMAPRAGATPTPPAPPQRAPTPPPRPATVQPTPPAAPVVAPPAAAAPSAPATPPPTAAAAAAFAPPAAAPVAIVVPPAPAPVVQPPVAAPVASPAIAAPTPSVGVLADPFGLAAPPSAPAVAPVALVAPAPSAAPAGDARPSVMPESRVPARRHGTHPMALAFIVMAGVFGGVAAYQLFTRPPQMPQVVVVQSPAPPPSTAVGVPATADPGVVAAPAVIDAPGAPSGVGRVAAGGPLPGKSADPKAAAGPSAAPIDMSGFAGGAGKPAGPSAVGPGGDGPAAGGGQLSAGEISGVVEAQKARVKRKCWQPALDARAKGGPSTARVSAMLTIGPSGNVDSVSASGGERDFPGLASCIASSVKGWKFPRSGGSTPANVPFVFASQ